MVYQEDYNMDEILHSPIFEIVVTLILLYVVYRVLARLFRKKKSTPLMPRMICNDCGWEGQVGKYDQKCRKCSSSNLRSAV